MNKAISSVIAFVGLSLGGSCFAQAQSVLEVYNSNESKVKFWFKQWGTDDWRAVASVSPGQRLTYRIPTNLIYEVTAHWSPAPGITYEFLNRKLAPIEWVSGHRDFAEPFDVHFAVETVWVQEPNGAWVEFDPTESEKNSCAWRGAIWNGRLCLNVPQLCTPPAMTIDPPRQPRLPKFPKPKPKSSVGLLPTLAPPLARDTLNGE